MTVYVDKLFSTKQSRNWRYTAACHLFGDTTEELLEFAERLGMKWEWFQEHGFVPHFDLTRTKRQVALRIGAVEMSISDFLKRRLEAGNE